MVRTDVRKILFVVLLSFLSTFAMAVDDLPDGEARAAATAARNPDMAASEREGTADGDPSMTEVELPWLDLDLGRRFVSEACCVLDGCCDSTCDQDPDCDEPGFVPTCEPCGSGSPPPPPGGGSCGEDGCCDAACESDPDCDPPIIVPAC